MPTSQGTSSVSRRILIALIVAVLCALGIAIWTIGAITRQLDADSQAKSVKLVGAAWRQEIENIAGNVEDYATWGAAYKNLHQQVDVDWAFTQNNMGPSLFERLSIGHVYVVDPAGRVSYAMIDGKLTRDARSFEAIRKQLQPLVASARDVEANETQAFSSAVRTRAGLAVFAVAALSWGADSSITPSEGAPSVVVFGKGLGPEALRQIEQDTFISELHVAREPEDAAKGPSLRLETPDGAGLVLRWTPERPGAQLISSLAPTLTFASLALAVVLVLMTRSALTAANRMESSAKQLEQAYEDAQRRSMHDPTTGLANRDMLARHLAANLAAPGVNHALLYIDVDHFKSINDTYGHPAGDQVLRMVAETLLRSVRSGDLVSRIGGDEFVVLMCWRKIDEIEALCARLLKITAEPIEHAGQVFAIGLSIGVAMSPYDAETGDELIKLADIALYRAKAAGRRTFRFFADDPRRAEQDEAEAPRGAERPGEPARTARDDRSGSGVLIAR